MAAAPTILSEELNIPGFKLIRQLGEGGFATTYLFVDLKQEFASQVAVKVPKSKAEEEALISGDIISLASLGQVPNIARIYDVKRVSGRYLLFMEYVDGPLLRDVLQKKGRLALGQAIKYAIGVAEGLARAHENKRVHRDIKPDNIIIERSSDLPKILDFGIASSITAKGHFETSLGRHTKGYTPPEVLLQGRGDHRVDIFGLGVMLYEMLTGSQPYDEPDLNPYQVVQKMQKGQPRPLREIRPEIPLSVERTVLSAISPKESDRCPNMEAFITGLRPYPELKLAKDHLAAGSISRAELVLRSLMKRQPDDPEGYIALANLLNRVHRSAEAVKLLQKAVELDPANANTRLRLGMTLSLVGERDKARASLEKALEICNDPHAKKMIIATMKKTC